MKTVYLLRGINREDRLKFIEDNLSDLPIVDSVMIASSVTETIEGGVLSKGDEKLLKAIYFSSMEDCLREHDSVVINSSNISGQDRREVYEAIAKFKPKIIVLDFAKRQESLRDRLIRKSKEGGSGVANVSLLSSNEITNVNDMTSSAVTLKEPVSSIWHIENGKIVAKENKILLATTNPGKVDIYTGLFEGLGLATTSLMDIGVDIEVEENGRDEVENAEIKAQAYYEATGLPTFANDSGLIIDKFAEDNQPRQLVRRYKGKELSDRDLLDLYVELLTEVGGESEGHYNVALAIVDNEGNMHSQLFESKRYFISKPSKVIRKGLPLDSLSYNKKMRKYQSEMNPQERGSFEMEINLLQEKFIKDALGL